jgi:succinate dehydrogenase / fumarate reductase cytochrome b subunit
MLPSDSKKRPLSPHLQIYKIQITSLLSILHRGTGIALYGGAVIWALWFFALAMGSQCCEQMQAILLSPLGLVLLFGWTFSFFYHLCNGIRHLCWDMGKGYDMPTVRLTGWTVVITSSVLTGATWLWGVL